MKPRGDLNQIEMLEFSRRPKTIAPYFKVFSFNCLCFVSAVFDFGNFIYQLSLKSIFYFYLHAAFRIKEKAIYAKLSRTDRRVLNA